MSPRPKHPPADRRQEILDAALRVFARHGYTAATNAHIAREAGVTTAALYYYFSSKEDMFRAAISERKGEILPGLADVFHSQLADQPPQVVVPALIEKLLDFLTEERTIAIMRLLLSEGPRNPQLMEIWQGQVVGEIAPILFQYALQQIEKGTVRRMDPRMLFMLINGPVLSTILTRDLLKVPLLQELTNHEIARQVGQAVLEGIAVDLGEKS